MATIELKNLKLDLPERYHLKMAFAWEASIHVEKNSKNPDEAKILRARRARNAALAEVGLGTLFSPGEVAK